MIDSYFKKPLFWDYLFVIILSSTLYFLIVYDLLIIPSKEKIDSISSDISTVGLTSAGFIITLLTVLITFKSSSRVKENNAEHTTFELLFASELYFETVKHLKNCIKSLIFISVLGYLLKLILTSSELKYNFIYCFNGLLIVVLSLWRCLLILSKILKLQKEE